MLSSLNDPTNIVKRIGQRVKAMGVEDKILNIAHNAYKEALQEEKVILSQGEQNRLLCLVMKDIFEETLKKL